MTDLESFFTDRRQKEGKDAEECIKTILAEGTCNDAYTKREYRFPVPNGPSSIINNMRPCIAFNPREPERSDMIDTLECNVEFSVHVGGTKYNTYNISRVLTLCLAFHQPQIRVYLDQPNMPKEIVFSQRNHHFSDELRRSILHTMNPNGVLDGDILYAWGMACKPSDFTTFNAEVVSTFTKN
jgi:hypothetical protein